MDELPDDPPRPAPSGPLARWWTLLLTLVLVGLPLVVSTNLLGLRPAAPAQRGDQPGGTLTGSLRGPEGALGGVVVELRLVGEQVAVEPVASTISAEDGSWSLQAPPVTAGAYRLRAGGGDWRYEVRETGFLGSDGKPLDPGPVDFELVPGCTLEVELLRASGLPVGGGRFTVRGTYRDGGVLALVPQVLEFGPRDFEGSRIQQGGLPPVRGEVHVVLDSGEQLTFEVQLAEGASSYRFEL